MRVVHRISAWKATKVVHSKGSTVCGCKTRKMAKSFNLKQTLLDMAQVYFRRKQYA